MWNPFRKKTFEEEFAANFNSTKAIKIDGVPFIIRKVNVLDYLEGGKVLSDIFSTYKTGKQNPLDDADLGLFELNMKKAEKYLTDIICSGTVKPKFIRENQAPEPGAVPIKDLFTDWILAQKLADHIFEFTYGKKK
jgi:hypothetical protein